MGAYCSVLKYLRPMAYSMLYPQSLNFSYIIKNNYPASIFFKMLSTTLRLALGATITSFTILTQAVDQRQEFTISDAGHYGCVLDVANICGCTSAKSARILAPGNSYSTPCEALVHSKLPNPVTVAVPGCSGSAQINFNPPYPAEGYPITYLTDDKQCSMGCDVPDMDKMAELTKVDSKSCNFSSTS